MCLYAYLLMYLCFVLLAIVTIIIIDIDLIKHVN